MAACFRCSFVVSTARAVFASQVGWVSLAAAIYHFVHGNVPVALWVTGLPGILIGATIGPWLALQCGRRFIIVLFMLFIVADIVRNAVYLSLPATWAEDSA